MIFAAAARPATSPLPIAPALPRPGAAADPAPPAPPLTGWRTGRGANRIPEGRTVEVGVFDRRGRLGGSGLRFDGGLAAAYKGVEVLVEVGGTAPPEALLQTIRGYLDTLGPGELKLLTQVEVLADPCPEDAYWAKKYGIPGFFVRALTGGGVTQLWRGNPRNLRVFHHEQAHLLDFSGNVPRGEWTASVKADDQALAAKIAAGWKLVELPVTEFDVERDHLRLAPGGITGYAEFARQNAGTLTEDVAESVAWSRLSGRMGAIARATAPDGSVHDLTFADLFPGRAKLVAAALARVNA